jgi:uncharacterized protein (TIGR02680 family)
MTVTSLRSRRQEPITERSQTRRWRPSRAGILNIWRYHDETFEFHRGRLLLRGPNGSGKSKALELLLPFLLDANLRASRLSTFGSERTMHWNLMSGWEGTTRVGYAWIEFTRPDGQGQPQWFTCGARLSATSNSRNVTPVYFTTDRRIGVRGGISLVNDAGRPLTRSDLIEQLGRDSVHESAEGYRATVTQALYWGFAADKYDALLAALLQLRVPKLSEHLNPEELSRVLSQALPPLDHQAVAEIAEGFEKLDRRREALTQLEREVHEAELLASRARTYARRVLRAAAAELTSATTRMDDVTRRARERRSARDETGQQLADLEADLLRMADAAHALEQRIAGLQETDAYKQGRQLVALREQAARAGDRASQARRRAESSSATAQEDHDNADQAATVARQAIAAADRAGDETRVAATRVGLETALEQALPVEDLRRTRTLLRAAAEARAGQIKQVRDALDQHAEAVRQRDAAERRLRQRRAELDRAERDLKASERAHDDALERLRGQLLAWASACQELPLADRSDELTSLAADEAAVLRLVGRAAEPVRDDLARQRSTVEHERARLLSERAKTAAGLTELEKRPLLSVPEAPGWRTSDRSALPGAPLWRLVDWAADVDPGGQALVEAALEAAGLLDAWVLPHGGVTIAGHDSFAEAALAVPVPGPSLATVLTVEPDAPVPAERVAGLLAGIGFGPTAPDHPAAVGADGTWRLASTHGSAGKPAASLIGEAARERARQRRLAELRDRLVGLDQEITATDEQLESLDHRRSALGAELDRRPRRDELTSAERRREQAGARAASLRDTVAEADEEREDAEALVTRALRLLTTTASDTGLPAARAALDAVAEALRAYRQRADTWMDLLNRVETCSALVRAAQDQAERSAERADQDQSQAGLLEREVGGLRARLAAIEGSVGVEFRQVLDRLQALKVQAEALETDREAARQRRHKLGIRLGQLEEQLAGEERAREAAAAERDAAADAFRRLDGLGLVTEAGLPAELGMLSGTRAALEAARQVTEVFASVPYERRNLKDAEARLAETTHQVRQALAGYADLALEADEHGLVLLTVTVDGLRMGARALLAGLVQERDRTQEEVSDQEEELFDRTLTGEARRQVADRIRLADLLVRTMNTQLQKVRTASELRVRLRWQVDPELPAGTTAARELLLTDPHKLTDADRLALHAFLKGRIEEVRAANTATGWEQQLLEVLDYTRWHQFVVQMDRQDGSGWIDVTKRRHAALSGGEKAIVLHLPLFAAAAAHYQTAPEAPRLILLDEVFVGVDADNRGQLLRLLAEFDLDLMLTSDHEWCTYAELDGIAIHQLMTGDGDDAVTTARFVWDGFQVTPTEVVR